VILKDQHTLQNVINKLSSLNMDRPWWVEVTRCKNTRSIAQNKLFWMWLKIWGDDLGYSKDEMYDVVVSRLWPLHDEERLSYNGQEVARQRRTSQLTTKDFTALLDNIDREAANTGTVLPKPEDIYYEAMGWKK
jgi:hypothetical protein